MLYVFGKEQPKSRIRVFPYVIRVLLVNHNVCKAPHSQLVIYVPYPMAMCSMNRFGLHFAAPLASFDVGQKLFHRAAEIGRVRCSVCRYRILSSCCPPLRNSLRISSFLSLSLSLTSSWPSSSQPVSHPWGGGEGGEERE